MTAASGLATFWPERVYYDIEGDQVNVLGIVPKDRADEWLAQLGEPQ